MKPITNQLSYAVLRGRLQGPPKKRPRSGRDTTDNEIGSNPSFRSVKRLRETTEVSGYDHCEDVPLISRVPQDIQDMLKDLVELRGKLGKEYEKRIKQTTDLKREEAKVNAMIEKLCDHADMPAGWWEKVDQSSVEVDTVLSAGLDTIAEINGQIG
jgi:hypothetical protein